MSALWVWNTGYLLNEGRLHKHYYDDCLTRYWPLCKLVGPVGRWTSRALTPCRNAVWSGVGWPTTVLDSRLLPQSPRCTRHSRPNEVVQCDSPRRCWVRPRSRRLVPSSCAVLDNDDHNVVRCAPTIAALGRLLHLHISLHTRTVVKGHDVPRYSSWLSDQSHQHSFERWRDVSKPVSTW